MYLMPDSQLIVISWHLCRIKKALSCGSKKQHWQEVINAVLKLQMKPK